MFESELVACVAATELSPGIDVRDSSSRNVILCISVVGTCCHRVQTSLLGSRSTTSTSACCSRAELCLWIRFMMEPLARTQSIVEIYPGQFLTQL
jgi:hypothetical protein